MSYEKNNNYNIFNHVERKGKINDNKIKINL